MEVMNADAEIDAIQLVTDAHSLSTNSSCHCPVGVCMGQHEEPLPPPISPLESGTD